MINLPVSIAIAGGPIVLVIVSRFLDYPGWMTFAGILLCFIFSWFIWSVQITKWKVWAFENVRNVHELKRRAISEKLIWPENSFFNRTEIWTSNDRKRWESLQAKFLVTDEFIVEEDLTVPSETIVYYSKRVNYLEMLGGLLVLGVGIFMLINKQVLFGAIVCGMGIYFAIRNWKQAGNTEPQIVLNDEGMQTISTAFFKWEDIEEEDVLREYTGDDAAYYLVYKHPGGAERLNIEDYEITPGQLKKLMKVYRSRSIQYRR